MMACWMPRARQGSFNRFGLPAYRHRAASPNTEHPTPMYANWAEFYDEVYVDQYDTGDLAFYLNEAKAAAGPVLEAGCGTGRILLPTLAAGVDIDGFDREPVMLARL